MKLLIKIELNFHKFSPKLLVKMVNEKYQVARFEKFIINDEQTIKLSEDFESTITELWKNNIFIVFKGKSSLRLSLKTNHSGIISINGEMSFSSTKKVEVINDLIKIIKIFSEDGILLYGSITSEKLFNEKHKMMTYYDSGGFSYGWEGISSFEFLDFLPGIYWFTAFGKDYVKAIGKEALLSIDQVEYLSLYDNTVAFFHFKDIEELNLEDCKIIEEKIGANHFFDQEREVCNLFHPNAFKKVLDNIQSVYKEKYP